MFTPTEASPIHPGAHSDREAGRALAPPRTGDTQGPPRVFLLCFVSAIALSPITSKGDFMADARLFTRRSFLTSIGKTGFAVAVMGAGVVACTDDSSAGSTPSGETTTSGRPTSTTAGPPATATTSTSLITELGPVEWERVDLGFVSAYVLFRGGEAAVVDTGTDGSAPQIETVLNALGLDWSAVGHVIATHSHGDHIGSLGDVMSSAAAATGYAGAADIPSITAPRPLTEVGDGDRVFGLDIIATPGHTPGHISVLDAAGGLLLAGDALNGKGGKIVGPNRQFSANIATANESARKLADLDIDAVVFGHGEPVLSGVGEALKALAAGL